MVSWKLRLLLLFGASVMSLDSKLVCVCFFP